MTAALPRVYVHNPHAPRQRLAELTTAWNVDRSFTLMQEARESAGFDISRTEPLLSQGILQRGALVCIEGEPGLPPWAGYMSLLRESDNAGMIDVTCVGFAAGLEAHPTRQAERYEDSIGAGPVFAGLVRYANSLEDTGIYLPSTVEPGRAVRDIDLAGQSVLSAIVELAERSGDEWALEITARPARLEGLMRWTAQAGEDLSASVILQQGVHFAALDYELDLTQMQDAVTVYGGGGAVIDRPGVTLSSRTAPQRRGLAAVLQQANDAVAAAVADLPVGLRTERLVYAPGATNESELSRQARRALEKPLGAAERFWATVNRVMPWRYLLPGNYVRVKADLGLGAVDRRMRVLGLQPDEELGVAEVVLEVATA